MNKTITNPKFFDMFERYKILYLGHQPITRITTKTLDIIIRRDYPDNFEVVKQKLESIKSESINGKNRLSTAVLRLSNGDLTKIDEYLEICNNDYRDVVSKAEYPRSSKLGFEEFDDNSTRLMKKNYLDDWIEYQNWINKK